MTLVTLLRHTGIDVPRGVTVDGRILTGHAATAAISAHTARALAPHRFHGGDDPFEFPTREPSRGRARKVAEAWWNVDDEAALIDIAAVQSAFPGFVLDRADGAYNWEGMIDSGLGRFRVRIVGSPTQGLPAVVPVAPHVLGRYEGRRGFRRAPHLYTSSNLCVADATVWDPADHDTATVIGWAAHWYAAYVVWRFGGAWPTDGYGTHAAA